VASLRGVDAWVWVWFAAMAGFVLGELVVPGTFYVISFGGGALIAGILALAGVDVGVQLIAFVLGSIACGAGLRPLARRLERTSPRSEIGADRWVGRRAKVVKAIPAGTDELGSVRIDREEWRADSHDGRALPEGTIVEVLAVQGTRVVVRAVGPDPAAGPPAPPPLDRPVP
jgi:membrane protein implicated in regulation of membrane protease activity